MKCLLFGLTGFGNSVLNGILATDIFESVIVVTRKEKDVFPYYSCDQLTDLCSEKEIECWSDIDLGDPSGVKFLQQTNPDVIITATYHQKIPSSILSLPATESINIHPSLLPDYRGATPTNWSIICGEMETGITFHTLEVEMDRGDILCQERITIGDKTDGQLRKALAMLAERTIHTFLRLFFQGALKHQPQKKGKGSYYPKITSREGLMLIHSGDFPFSRVKQGLTPYPGVDILKRKAHEL
ncbi:MAG: formyltransferase family protein [Desulfobacterales bacterium]|nr:formyltransferase family protein [Desulfobacterales bacterium]MDP6806701.1 formyltransferase family protein [Desulfobacterales bacterium]|tara:strand:+ start:3126 stop:3851 length:726 start_codon:yes stop_codon:yes gene_type:complete